MQALACEILLANIKSNIQIHDNTYSMELLTISDLLRPFHICTNSYVFVRTFVLTLQIAYHEPCNKHRNLSKKENNSV